MRGRFAQRGSAVTVRTGPRCHPLMRKGRRLPRRRFVTTFTLRITGGGDVICRLHLRIDCGIRTGVTGCAIRRCGGYRHGRVH